MRGETSGIRFDEAKKLLDYGFSNFEYVEYSKKGDKLKNLPVRKGTVESVQVLFEENAGTLVPKGKSNSIETNIVLPDTVQAPIAKGDILGEVQFMINGETIGNVNLIADNDVKKLNLGNMIVFTLRNWFLCCRGD